MAFNPHEQLASVPIVAQQSAHMAHAYRNWPAAYWQRQTFCTGWNAADIVAHLASGADFYTQVISAGRTGTPGLPWQAQSLDDIRRIRTAAVHELLSGGQATLLAGFVAAAARLQDVLESLRHDDLTRMAWHPRGLIPIGCWIGMRLIELTVHDWDIRQPHDDHPRLTPLAVEAVLTSLPEMQQRFLTQRLPPQKLDGVYGLQAGTRRWAFGVHGTQATYLPEVPSDLTTCLRTDAERMVLLTLGRADLHAALRQKQCTLTGDDARGIRLYEVLCSPYLSSSATPAD